MMKSGTNEDFSDRVLQIKILGGCPVLPQHGAVEAAGLASFLT